MAPIGREIWDSRIQLGPNHRPDRNIMGKRKCTQVTSASNTAYTIIYTAYLLFDTTAVCHCYIYYIVGIFVHCSTIFIILLKYIFMDHNWHLMDILFTNSNRSTVFIYLALQAACFSVLPNWKDVSKFLFFHRFWPVRRSNPNKCLICIFLSSNCILVHI